MTARKLNKVAIIMGSQSDYSTMKYCKQVLQSFRIKFDIKIVSAHRTPRRMFDFAKKTKPDIKASSIKKVKYFPKDSSININKLESLNTVKNNKQKMMLAAGDRFGGTPIGKSPSMRPGRGSFPTAC